MKTVLKYLIPVALALVSCKKAVDTVDPEPSAVEPAAWFVEGLASADASNPTTRSWEYTNAASGEDVLKFKWAGNAYVPGEARFEGYWLANGMWVRADGEGYALNTILNDDEYPTYVENTDAGDFIHVSLPAAASHATKLLVVYTGSNINHTYWFDDPDHADVSLNSDGSAISLLFDAHNKWTFYVPGQDNNEVIYGVADITPEALTPDGENASASVDFDFRHLESVFRVRMRNMTELPITLSNVTVTANADKGGDDEAPFAGQLLLTCSDNGISPEAAYGESFFEATPASYLPDPKGEESSDFYITLEPDEYLTVYMMPMANPACDISQWDFTFSAYSESAVVGLVTVPGSAIADATREDGETWTPLKPGYVYTVNMRVGSPYIDYEVNGSMLHFIRESNMRLRLLQPSDGNQYTGDIEIPETVTVAGLTYKVETINSYAFANQTGLTNVTIPSSVTYVGKAAFGGCTSLTSVSFPEYAYLDTEAMFYGCSNLTSVTLPTSGWSSMRAQMFWGCSSLASLTIPACVTNTLGDGVFTGCTALGGHIDSDSEYAVIEENTGVVYSYQSNWDHYWYDDIVLSWIPENFTGDEDGFYQVRLATARIKAYATCFLALKSMSINSTVVEIGIGNFMETPNLETLKVWWSSDDKLTNLLWGGYTYSSLPDSGQNTFHNWYFALNSDEKMQDITISVPKNCLDLYNRQPFTYWAERGAHIVARTVDY